LLVARHICRLHQHIFNSLRFTIDVNYHTDLSGHGFPDNFTQIQADAWGREHRVNWLDSPIEEISRYWSCPGKQELFFCFICFGSV